MTSNGTSEYSFQYITSGFIYSNYDKALMRSLKEKVAQIMVVKLYCRRTNYGSIFIALMIINFILIYYLYRIG